VKWGKRGSAQYRKANRKYQQRWRKRKPVAFRSITLRHYYRHRKKMLAQAKLRREKHQRLVNRAKSKPCVDCEIRYPPYVMDFDHVRGRKMFQIGGNLHLSTKRILAEIAKCDVVCANCHRERTHGPKPAKKAA
jgi:hypothetical protein